MPCGDARRRGGFFPRRSLGRWRYSQCGASATELPAELPAAAPAAQALLLEAETWPDAQGGAGLYLDEPVSAALPASGGAHGSGDVPPQPAAAVARRGRKRALFIPMLAARRRLSVAAPGRATQEMSQDLDRTVQAAVDRLLGEVFEVFDQGAAKARLPPQKGKGSIQECFHVGNRAAAIIHRRANARLSMAGFCASRGPGKSREYSAHEVFLAGRLARHPGDERATDSGVCACGGTIEGLTLVFEGGGQEPLGSVCHRCVCAAVQAVVRAAKPRRLRRKSTPILQLPVVASLACAAEAVGILPLLSRLRRSLSGTGDLRAAPVKREAEVVAPFVKVKQEVERAAVKRESSTNAFSSLPAPRRFKVEPVVVKREPSDGACPLSATSSAGRARWRRSVLHAVALPGGRVDPPPCRGVPFLLGSDALPGWSARLLAFLGETVDVAQPFACVDRRVLRLLAADASQLAAEFRPLLRCLAATASLGTSQAGEEQVARALCPAQILSVLWSLPGRLLVPRPNVSEALLAEVDAIRLRRAEGLLAALAAKACRIARTLSLQA